MGGRVDSWTTGKKGFQYAPLHLGTLAIFKIGVSFGNNAFVAVCTSGYILRSTDNGTNWDNVTSGTTNHLRGVTF